MTSPLPLARDLARRVRGEVRAGDLDRGLFSCDASLYEIRPLAVVAPRDAADVESVVGWCAGRGVPILPRGGGTSLAGQAVGEGVVLDFTRHMHRIRSVDPEGRRVTVEPGRVLDRLNAALAPHRLKFAPDPAASSRSVVGGAIANNSTGARSLVYDRTDAHVASLDLLLADGTRVRTRRLAREGEELAGLIGRSDREGRLYRDLLGIREGASDEIDLRWPTHPRNVMGYNLRDLLREGGVDLSRLVCGSEGTLAIVLEATLDLVSVPTATGGAILFFPTLRAAMEAVPAILDRRPAALELVDGTLLRLASERPGYREIVAGYPPGTGALLLVEFDGEASREVVDRARRLAGAAPSLGASGVEIAGDLAALLPHRGVRKAGLPILMSRTSDAKHLPFVEDCAVPPERLPEYIEGFESILTRHGTSAAYYAHAGAGCLHIRPLIDLKRSDGIAAMRGIDAEVAELVLSLGGTVSGEHGDGLARTQWMERQYGPGLVAAFREVKRAFDPRGILNPGKIVAADADLARHLRIDPTYRTSFPEPEVDFSAHDGYGRAIELCNGCGGCRTIAGGIMCPSFRVTGEEIDSTRGRANLMRLAIAGRLPEGALHSSRFREAVLDRCLGCKACKTECPSGVDLARLKIETLHQSYLRHGVPLRARLLAALPIAARIGSLVPGLANRLARSAPARWAASRLGLDPSRPLPRFDSRTFAERFRRRTSVRAGAVRVRLLADCFTNFFDPGVGEATVRILESAGVAVELLEGVCCGRTAYSAGLLGAARRNARRLLAVAGDGPEPFLAIEPSCASMLFDDLPELLPGAESRRLARRTREVLDWLEGELGAGRLSLPLREIPQRIALHGHCHQRTLGWADATARILSRIPGTEATLLDTACCGMAGAYGYETAVREVSAGLGGMLVSALGAHGGRFCLPGFSCRSQVQDLLGLRPPHPAEILAGAVDSE